MCQFIEAMEGLKSSSNLSVANDKFSKFNRYMHIASKMDDRLKVVISNAKAKSKSLVLVCGNSGDGKGTVQLIWMTRNFGNFMPDTVVLHCVRRRRS